VWVSAVMPVILLTVGLGLLVLWVFILTHPVARAPEGAYKRPAAPFDPLETIIVKHKDFDASEVVRINRKGSWTVAFQQPYEDVPRLSISEDMQEHFGVYQLILTDSEGDNIAHLRYDQGKLREIMLFPKAGITIRSRKSI